jgi:hypothetical protein
MGKYRLARCRADQFEITEDDLLTWELQLVREGTLPPDVQRRLVEVAGRYLEKRVYE